MTYKLNCSIIKQQPCGGCFKKMEIKNLPSKIINFLKEVHLELKKVNWLTRQEALKYTLIVIGISVATAAFLGGLDVIFITLLNKFIL